MRNSIPNAVLDIAAPILVAVLWGSAFVTIKVALRDFSPTSLVALRFLGAAIGFLVLYLLRVIRFNRIERVDLGRFALLVILGILVYHLCLATAEVALPASMACLIGQTTALFALAFQTIHDGSLPRVRTLAGAAVASFGTILVVSNGQPVSSNDPIGTLPVVICFGAPLSLAAYTLLGKPLIVHYGAANLTAQVCICGGAILGLASAVRREFVDEILHASSPAWIALGCLAVLSTVLAYTLWYMALERRSAAKLTMFTYLTPVFGVLLSAVILGESVGLSVIAGGVVVVGGVALTNLK